MYDIKKNTKIRGDGPNWSSTLQRESKDSALVVSQGDISQA